MRKKAENIVIYAESKKVYKLKKILVDYLIKDAKNDLNEEDFIRYKKSLFRSVYLCT